MNNNNPPVIWNVSNPKGNPNKKILTTEYNGLILSVFAIVKDSYIYTVQYACNQKDVVSLQKGILYVSEQTHEHVSTCKTRALAVASDFMRITRVEIADVTTLHLVNENKSLLKARVTMHNKFKVPLFTIDQKVEAKDGLNNLHRLLKMTCFDAEVLIVTEQGEPNE